MNDQVEVNLPSVLEKARLQLESRLSWRAYRITIPEMIAMIEDEAEYVSHFICNGKQTVLAKYEGVIFSTESSELMVFQDSDDQKIVNRYMH